MAWLLALRKVSTESVDNSVGNTPEYRIYVGLQVHWLILAQFKRKIKII